MEATGKSKTRDVGSRTVDSVWSALAELVRLIVEMVRRGWRSEDAKYAERQRLKSELALALREGRVTDAGFIRKKLEALCLVLGLGLGLCLPGCKTPVADVGADVPVYGERINVVKPGEVVTIQEYIAPAVKWYLVDDVGLAGWLGLDVPGAAGSALP